jgi:hypothetical protein
MTDNCIQCSDEKSIKDADGIAKELIKDLINPFKKTELPIRVFEPSSNIEKIVRAFELSPHYLH